MTEDQIQQALTAHNSFRETHLVSALAWNDSLAQIALTWADNCVWEHGGYKECPDGCGENLYAVSAPSTNMSACVWAWNNEESMYNYSNPGFSEATGHFTCKLAIFDSDTSTYGVCEYYPAGNIVNAGEFA
ncbi:extracellular SCP domain protein Pry1 [Pseudohyphozyma bogoriensis]|nr:extracellular SCP domain protein Pry1 [Pseudohyphozyma bogoriensis]